MHQGRSFPYASKPRRVLPPAFATSSLLRTVASIHLLSRKPRQLPFLPTSISKTLASVTFRTPLSSFQSPPAALERNLMRINLDQHFVHPCCSSADLPLSHPSVLTFCASLLAADQRGGSQFVRFEPRVLIALQCFAWGAGLNVSQSGFGTIHPSIIAL